MCSELHWALRVLDLKLRRPPLEERNGDLNYNVSVDKILTHKFANGYPCRSKNKHTCDFLSVQLPSVLPFH